MAYSAALVQDFPFTPVIAQNSANLETWKKIQNVDLTFVSKKVMSDRNWSEEQTKAAVQSYRIFLFLSFLSRKNKQSVIPFKVVDHVWHSHILQSVERYRSDSLNALGFVLDHKSSLKGADEDSDSIEMGAMLSKEYLPMMVHNSEYAGCDGHASCESDF